MTAGIRGGNGQDEKIPVALHCNFKLTLFMKHWLM
jgi:hypothetical protein